ALASATREAPARSLPLARSAGGVWSTVLPLAPGRYTFHVVVDDTRSADVPVSIEPRPSPPPPSARPGGDST
ncbi:MAG TPA: hypothetical protein VF041_00010, partial [Gemmatimonadaceae bacterium]